MDDAEATRGGMALEGAIAQVNAELQESGRVLVVVVSSPDFTELVKKPELNSRSKKLNS